jgi:hypothetical protein
MKMYDCDVCLSAGSVNKWGFCEICGEDFEDPGSHVMVREFVSSTAMSAPVIEEAISHTETKLVSVGQDAA